MIDAKTERKCLITTHDICHREASDVKDMGKIAHVTIYNSI